MWWSDTSKFECFIFFIFFFLLFRFPMKNTIDLIFNNNNFDIELISFNFLVKSSEKQNVLMTKNALPFNKETS